MNKLTDNLIRKILKEEVSKINESEHIHDAFQKMITALGAYEEKLDEIILEHLGNDEGYDFFDSRDIPLFDAAKDDIMRLIDSLYSIQLRLKRN